MWGCFSPFMVIPPKIIVEDSRRDQINLLNLFPPGEHGIYMYYGRIGSGKTYAMTADILEALHKGKVVYTNYPINYMGYDQSWSFFWLLLGLFGVKRKYYNFSKDNLRRIEIDADFQDTFSELTDCIVALDEGYVVFDSYQMAKMPLKNRKNVYHTRHFDRSIWITSQRPTAVHVSMRSQVNVFYKITRLIKIGSFLLFRRQELDMASDETVDENKVYSTKLYIGKKDIFNAYDTKYLRQGANASQYVHVDIIRLSYSRIWQRFLIVFKKLSPLKGRKLPQSLGGNVEATTIKNIRGLNTTDVGGVIHNEIPF